MSGVRSWTDSDRLSGDDINDYLMGQCTPRFADADDRDAQMGGVVPGMFCYLLDPGVLQNTDPSSTWVNTIPDPVPPPAGPLTGTATLVDGTATVACPAVTDTSNVRLTAQNLGTVTVPSALAVSARTAGTGFTILASQSTDTSAVAWLIDPA